MGFSEVTPGRKGKGAPRHPPRESNVRVGIFNGVTQIHVPRKIAEQLEVTEATSILPIMVAVGSEEHAGLIQIQTKPAKANRIIAVKAGRLTVTLPRKITGLGAEKMSPTPVSWRVADNTLTLELPESRFQVAPSAKDYMAQTATV